MSYALIFASTNPQYDNRFFIELPVQYKKIAGSKISQNMLCTQIVFCLDIQNNLCTQHVLKVFWACNFHALNLWFNEQSFVILWVSWCMNKCFWKRFTCTLYYCKLLKVIFDESEVLTYQLRQKMRTACSLLPEFQIIIP